MNDYQTVVLNGLGERIRALRAESTLTRRELSHRSGVSERYLASLEGGRANPSVVILCRLAMALERSVHTLLTEVDDRAVAAANPAAGKVAVEPESSQRPRVRGGGEVA